MSLWTVRAIERIESINISRLFSYVVQFLCFIFTISILTKIYFEKTYLEKIQIKLNVENTAFSVLSIFLTINMLPFN